MPAIVSFSIDALRASLKREDWQQVADMLPGNPGDLPGDLPLEACMAAYRSHTKLGHAELAEAWLDRVLMLAPANSTMQRDKGVCLQKRRDWAGALACFSRALDLRPDIASYHGAVGLAFHMLGDFEKSASEHKAALDIDGGNRSWWIRLARSLVHLNDLQGAIEAYDKALALQEDLNIRSARNELVRQIRSGSKAASSAYYDAIYASSAKYIQDGNLSDYAPVWERIIAALQAGGTRSILDLGCGPGQFAEFLAARLPDTGYAGIDFSAVAIDHARKKCPQYRFEQVELPIRDFSALPAFDTIICTEVLEHVEFDREVLAAVPAGTSMIASVPNFDTFSHVRYFPTEKDVIDRYGLLIDGLSVEGIEMSPQNTLWLMHGSRSANQLPVADAAPEPGARPFSSLVDLEPACIDAVLWSDGTRYVEDFLCMFDAPFVTIAESVDLRTAHVALRHDVDWSIENAYAMALLEHELGARSTYFLINPDGLINPANYFGHVDNGKLVIDPHLFDWAARLTDLGHEVAFHNDLISLALVTRRQPREFLEQIVEAFARRGIKLRGSVAHGSKLCREFGYLNYQIFSDIVEKRVAVDYQNSPELLDKFAQKTAERDGHVVEKFNLRMQDFGLVYEANFVPWEVYVSDSSARWSIWHYEELQSFERHEPRHSMQAHVEALLRAKRPDSAVQVLVHSCHWNVLAQFNRQSIAAVRKRRNAAYKARRAELAAARSGPAP